MSNGFTFNGVHSDAFSLIVNAKDIPLSPPIDNRLQEISGFDGAWDYGISYAPRPIEVECSILADSLSDLKTKARKLAGYLNPRKGAKPLIFDDDKGVMYYARLSNQIPLEQLGAFGTLTLQFTCPDPFTYGTIKRNQTVSNSGSVVNQGTHVARPKMVVSHGGGVGNVTNRSSDGTTQVMAFNASSPSGIYEIDCKEFTITRNGAAAYNFVDGDFLSFNEGSNSVSTSGAVSSVSFEYYDTWL